MKRCKRCGKKWCGTNKRMKQLYPDEWWPKSWRTYGTKKCRDKGPKR